MKKLIFLPLITLCSLMFGQYELSNTIDSIINQTVESELAPGLTVGVVKDGHLEYHSSRGCANLEYSVPFNDSTLFGLASITKQFTSACIGVLQNRGQLSINDDVRRYIPELHSNGDTIRIKHLLNHTSGIRNHNVLLDLMGFDYKHRGYTNTMIQELMFRQKGMNNRPGEKMLYSNTNYVLLALIIERLSGMPIHEFAKQELFAPLHMQHTFYQDDLESVIPNRAYPYYKDGATYKQPKSLTLCVGAGGMGSTVSDLAAWSQVFLNPTHKFSYLKDFITTIDTLNNGEQMKHARGMFVSPYKGHSTFNHSGRGVGMRSQFICVPDINLGIIVYTNSEHINAVNVSYAILDLFIEPKPALHADSSVNTPATTNADQVVGVYQELNSDLRMTLYIENDTLWAQSSFGRVPAALEANSPHCFHRVDNPSVQYSFRSTGKAEADLEVDFGGAIFYFERIELVKNPNEDLEQFTGTYYSKELDVTYQLTYSDNRLILNYPNNSNIILHEGQTDVFGANRRTKYTFKRAENGTVVSFEVAAEGTVKNILFERSN